MLRDLVLPEPILTLLGGDRPGHGDQIAVLAACGDRFATMGCDDDTIHVWDAQTGACIATRAFDRCLYVLLFVDAETLLFEEGSRLHRWSLAEDAAEPESGALAEDLAGAPDLEAHHEAAGTVAAIWTTSGSAALHVYTGHGRDRSAVIPVAGVGAVAVSPDGQRVLTTSRAGRSLSVVCRSCTGARLWQQTWEDTEDRAPRLVVGLDAVAVLCAASRVLSLPDGALRSAVPDRPETGAWTDDGLLLAADNVLTRWLDGAMTAEHRLAQPGAILHVAPVTGGLVVIIDREAVVLEPSLQQRRLGSSHLGPITAVSFGRDGAVFSTDGQTVAAWRVGEVAPLWCLPAEAASAMPPLSVAQPGPQSVCSADGSIRAETGEAYCGVKLHRPAGMKHLLASGVTPSVLALSPDAVLLATASLGGIGLYRTDTGKRVKSLGYREGDITVMAFSPDGQRLVSGHVDGTLSIWKVAR